MKKNIRNILPLMGNDHFDYL